jgi:hypothetical protein
MNKEKYIKFVRRANLWCLTYWNEKGEQKQEWFNTKKEAEEYKTSKPL